MIPVRVTTADGRQFPAGRIRNISLGGVFIESAEPQPFGSDVDLEFALPNESQRTIRGMGSVVWSTKTTPEKAPGMQGMGVRLTHVGLRGIRSVAEFIQLRSPA
jgi:uncharacterized protein (TIGR02266 family)